MVPRFSLRAAFLVACAVLQPAVCALAQAAAPFPEEIVVRPERRSHLLAYVTLAAGAGLIGASFGFAEHANDTWDEYGRATDPARITDLYDETVRYDRFSSGALLAGEALIATGLYLRFLRRPAPVQVSVGPDRCAVAFRF